MSTVHLELAQELFTLAEVPAGTPSQSAAKIIALELYRERRVSAGKAAELANVSLEDFLAFSAERNVPIDYTLEEWEGDQTTKRDIKL